MPFNIQRFNYLLVIPASILLFSGCDTAPSKPAPAPTMVNKIIAQPAAFEEISMIGLIAAPEKYDGKPVRVIGYLSMQPDNDVIFLQREDHDYKLTRNCIGVEIPKNLRNTYHYKKCNKKYVAVEGIFNMKIKNPDSFSGCIVNIKTLVIHNYD